MRLIKKSIVILLTTICVFACSQITYAITFSPSISLKQEYNDNIYLENDGANKVEDWVTIVNPGCVFEAKTRKTGILVDYDVSHSFYKNSTENNAYRHNSIIDSWLKLSRHTEVGLSNRYIRTEETLTGEESTGINNKREPYYSNSTTADIDHIFGDERSVNVAYTYSFLENEDPAIEDNISHSGSFFLKYYITKHLGLEEEASYEKGDYELSPGFVRIKSRTRLTHRFSSKFDVFAEYSHTDYKNETMTNNSGSFWDDTNWSYDNGETFSISNLIKKPRVINENYRIYNPSTGFNWTFEEGSTFSINAGYFLQENEVGEDEDGATIDVDIGKQWRFKRGLISLTGNSGYEDKQLQSENLGFNIYYQGAVQFQYNLTKKMEASLNVSYRNDNYVETDNDQGDRIDDNYDLSTTVFWQVRKWMSTNLAYSYRNRDSNNDVNDYIENKIVLSLSLLMDNR